MRLGAASTPPLFTMLPKSSGKTTRQDSKPRMHVKTGGMYALISLGILHGLTTKHTYNTSTAHRASGTRRCGSLYVVGNHIHDRCGAELFGHELTS